MSLWAAAVGASEAGVWGDVLGDAAAEPEPGFAASPAAFLQRSERESLCSFRQVRIRPPPGCTPAQSFCASSAQAARSAARLDWSSAQAAFAAMTAQARTKSVKVLTGLLPLTHPIAEIVFSAVGREVWIFYFDFGAANYTVAVSLLSVVTLVRTRPGYRSQSSSSTPLSVLSSRYFTMTGA